MFNKKLRMNKKAVSPIIATLLLVAIAVSAAVVTYTCNTSTNTNKNRRSRIRKRWRGYCRRSQYYNCYTHC